jgi:RNA polymerase sigma-70 factor, ECF subfamily
MYDRLSPIASPLKVRCLLPRLRLFANMMNMNSSITTSLDSPPKWSPLVDQIAAGNAAGFEELYRAFDGFRYYLMRGIGAERAEDAYHDLLLDVTNGIRHGALQDPECLAGYAQVIAHRKIVQHIRVTVKERRMPSLEDVVLRDSAPSPEQAAIRTQNMDIAVRILRAMPTRDREVLNRFYVKEETAQEIRAAMDLTETQFRLIKSRAKKRFAELGRNRIAGKSAMSETAVVSLLQRHTASRPA